MNDEIKFTGAQENGRLLIRDGASFARYLRTFGNKSLEIVVRVLRRRRTEKQNNWYWKVCSIIGLDFGYTKDEMHQIFRKEFLKEQEWREQISTGQRVLFERIRSTTELDTKEFSDYFECIIRFAAEHRIRIPECEKEVGHDQDGNDCRPERAEHAGDSPRQGQEPLGDPSDNTGSQG